MSLKDEQKRLSEAMQYVIDEARALDRELPPGELTSSDLHPCKCGYRVRRSDATQPLKPEWMETLHQKVAEPFIPERCKWVVRAMLVHWETCSMINSKLRSVN